MQVVFGLGMHIGDHSGVELEGAAIRSRSGAAIGILPYLPRRTAARIIDDAVSRFRRGRRLAGTSIGLARARSRHGDDQEDDKYR